MGFAEHGRIGKVTSGWNSTERFENQRKLPVQWLPNSAFALVCAFGDTDISP